MRLGVLGGTFDPPHVGHLLVANDAADALHLDRLLFVPAAIQPLKVRSASAPPADRLAMVRLLAGDDTRFAADPIEIERDGLSFTVDTLAAMAEREPDAERFFLVGADVLATLPRWREPKRVQRLARLVVLERAGFATEPVNSAAGALAPDVIFLPTRRVDVSSTEIRGRVAAGRSLRGFVPEPVADYIATHGLYR